MMISPAMTASRKGMMPLKMDSSGTPVLATTAYSTSIFPMFETPDEPVGDKAWTKLRINYEAPARRALRARAAPRPATA